MVPVPTGRLSSFQSSARPQSTLCRLAPSPLPTPTPISQLLNSPRHLFWTLVLFSWFFTTSWSSLSGGVITRMSPPQELLGPLIKNTSPWGQVWSPLMPALRMQRCLRSAWSTKQVLGLPTRPQGFTARPREQDTAAHCPARREVEVRLFSSTQRFKVSITTRHHFKT